MNFYVKGQTLTRAGKETIATEAVNFPNVEFTFDSSWDGVAGRTALFQNVNTIFNAVTPASGAGNTAYAVLLTSLGDGRYSCVVPHEVLEGEEAKKFIVTVFGGSVNNKRITTNPVTCEVVPSMYDPGQTPGTPTPSQWDQVVDLLEDIGDAVDEVPGLVEDVSDLEDEIADARIDTNDTTWPSLGDAIRGQVTGFKNYMQYSGFLAEITTQEGKKWQAGQNNTVELVDAEDNTTSAISAKILYQPTGCYIRMRNNNHSGQFTEWWGLNSEEVVIQNATNLVRNQFIFSGLRRGVVEIRFNSDTEKIAAAQVICSNETYGYQYDDVVANKQSIDWLTDNLTKEELIGTAAADRWQTEFTINPSVTRGDLLHIVGTSFGDLPMSMKLYLSGTSNEQKFYDSQNSEYNIDIYVYVNGTYNTFRVWSKYGNWYDLRVYKVTFSNHTYSTDEKDSGRRWTDGSIIYERTYHVNGFVELSQAPSDSTITQNYKIDNWDYRYTLVDYEIRQNEWQAQARAQYVTPDQGNSTYLAPSVFILDYLNSGSHANPQPALLCMNAKSKYVHGTIQGIPYYYQYFKADVTVYYMKTNYTVPFSANMVQEYISSGGSRLYDILDNSVGVRAVLKISGAIVIFNGYIAPLHKVKLMIPPNMYDVIRGHGITTFEIEPIIFMRDNDNTWNPVRYPSIFIDVYSASRLDMCEGFEIDLSDYEEYFITGKFCLGFRFSYDPSVSQGVDFAIDGLEIEEIK